MPITPSMVGAAINLVFTEKLLDVQKEATDRLIPFAERATMKAKEQFGASFTQMREFDEPVYGYVRGLPNYNPSTNAVYRGDRTGRIASANLVKSGAFGISRYNCGDREAAINAGLASGIIRSGELSAQAGIFEDTLVAAYAELKWVSLANSSRPLSNAGTARAFGGVANSLIRQSELLTSAAEKSVASLVYLSTSAFLQARDRASNRTAQTLPDNLTSENSSTQGLSPFQGVV